MMIKRLKSLLRILLSPLVFFWVGTREFWRFLNSLDPANPREIKLHEFVGTVLILLGATMFCFQVNSCGAKDNTPVPSPLTTYPMTVHPRVVWSQAVTSGTDISADVGLTESDGSLYAVGQNGDVSALNEETGKVLWRVRLGEIIASKPTVYAGKVYIGLLEGGLVVLEAKTGQTLWTKPMTSSIEAPIAVTDTLIVIHLHDGSVVALDPNTHAQLWMYDASSSPDLGLPQDSGAVLTDRTAILGFTNGQLISFDLRNGQVAWTRPIAFQDGSTEVERMVDVGTSILSGDTLYSAAYHGNVVSLDAMT
ncbi:MAG: hypothetical protein EBX40_05905, partial [Gammaproteobacteria bacterium]|nr:hypothetical protein [Gammaproteobacteria bacterium]